MLYKSCIALGALSLLTGCETGPTPAQLAGLSPTDEAAGWQGLASVEAWRGYKQADFPKQGWTLSPEGVLTVAAGGGGGDIITRDQYGDFEFALQFRTAPKANSGIVYRIAETGDYMWMTGPEYQVFDDMGNGTAASEGHSAGAMYDLYPPNANKSLRPAGEWNDARVRLRHGVLQHWLNGAKVVEAPMFDESGAATPEWLARIQASKFKDFAGFGLQARGHIGLQDHGDEVSYRNVRVRDLDAVSEDEITLFNGVDLTGWTAIVPDAASYNMKPEAVWTVQDGALICKGNPIGYIRTDKDYTNYILKLEWRFNPETKQAGNSGVLLRMVGPDKVWPKSVEAQLQSESAGDFWNIDEFQMTTDAGRTNGRNTRKTHGGVERPVGMWNDYEIIVNHGEVILKVNGEEMNRATNVAEVPGKICLQSEGAEIQFRNIRLMPLK